jgi:rod shape-determining protein MreC
MLVTAEGFSAGVICGRTGVQGILKGLGRTECAVTHVHSDEDVRVGDWFHTSGEDRIFPRGLPAGRVKSVGGSGIFREIVLQPAALERGMEELLIVTAPVHEALPEEQPAPLNAPLLPSPHLPSAPQPAAARESAPALETDADRVLEHYRREAAKRGAAYGDNDAAPRQNPSPSPPPPASVKP